MIYEFSKRLKIAMKNRKLSQEKLAEAIGVEPGIIKKFTMAKEYPNGGILLLMCRALDVSADYLLCTGIKEQEEELPKTRKEKLLEAFPKFRIDGLGVPDINPCIAAEDTFTKNCRTGECYECRKKWWNEFDEK